MFNSQFHVWKEQLPIPFPQNQDFSAWDDRREWRVSPRSAWVPGGVLRWQMDGTPPKTNMTMGNPPSEDVFPIEIGDFPMSC